MTIDQLRNVRNALQGIYGTIDRAIQDGGDPKVLDKLDQAGKLVGNADTEIFNAIIYLRSKES